MHVHYYKTKLSKTWRRPTEALPAAQSIYVNVYLHNKICSNRLKLVIYCKSIPLWSVYGHTIQQSLFWIARRFNERILIQILFLLNLTTGKYCLFMMNSSVISLIFKPNFHGDCASNKWDHDANHAILSNHKLYFLMSKVRKCC